MAEKAAAPAPLLELIAQDETAGYCDPVSGVCVIPGAAHAAADEDD